MDSMSCLQSYFESQNDTEAAALVADMIALLPSKYVDNASTISEDTLDMKTYNTEICHTYDQRDDADDDREVQLSIDSHQQQRKDAFLAKESEIAATKEAVSRWKSRAIAAETHMQQYAYQVELLKKRHKEELQKIELRYIRNLDAKNDIILSLKEQIEHLLERLNKHQMYRDIEFSTAEEDVVLAVGGEMRIDSHTAQQSQTGQTIRINEEVKFDTLLGNLNDIMSAMEEDLLRAQTIQHQRSQSFDTQSSNDSQMMRQTTASSTRNGSSRKHNRKSALFFKRMFKKAFPNTFWDSTCSSNRKSFYARSYQTGNSNTTNNVPSEISNDGYDEDDSLPRSSTDETLLGTYATVSSTTSRKYATFRPPHIMNILPSLSHQILT